MPMEKRTPPQSIEAEKAVLGAMLITKEAVQEVQEILQPEDFYRQANQLIYETMLELNADSDPVDLVSLTERLDKKKLTEKVGGVTYIVSLSNVVQTAANVKYYAKLVREKSELRHLIDAATKIATEAYEASEDVEDIMDDAEKSILAIASRQSNEGFESIGSLLVKTVEHIEVVNQTKGSLTGIATGFTDLDNITAGLQDSDLILVAARPSMGKTAFTLNIATYAALTGHTVAFFSLEMSKEQLVNRMLCAEGGIDSQRLRTGQLEKDEWDKLIQTANKLSHTNLYIDDTAGIDVMSLRSKARRLQAEKQGLDLIVIDYLQLMQGRTRSNSDNRQQEISEISRSLKALARELHVPVIALSQLSRSVESRTVKRPMLSDLRESGSLEQDADIVMFLYREDYYDQDTENKNITELIIAKHRNGPIGTVKLFFQKEFTRFRNLVLEE
jgi:replicative DNA helicase